MSSTACTVECNARPTVLGTPASQRPSSVLPLNRRRNSLRIACSNRCRDDGCHDSSCPALTAVHDYLPPSPLSPLPAANLAAACPGCPGLPRHCSLRSHWLSRQRPPSERPPPAGLPSSCRSDGAMARRGGWESPNSSL